MRKILLLTTLSLVGCRDSNDFPNPTQSGKETAGCIVNGSPLIAKGVLSKALNWGPPIVCTHSYYYGEYLNLSFHDQTRENLPGVMIYIRRQKIEQGKTYILSEDLNDDSKPYASAYYNNEKSYTTTQSCTGSITFTRFDSIASGTFEFDAVSSDGTKVKITQGRFDVSL